MTTTDPRPDRAPAGMPVVLDPGTWQARAAAHAERVDVWIQPHLTRRGAGVKHPVHDFLFDYYSQSPAALRRWHPGFGTALLDAPEYAGLKGYAEAHEHPDGSVVAAPTRDVPAVPGVVRDVPVVSCPTCPPERRGLPRPVTVTRAHLASQVPAITSIRQLLVATASRQPSLGCFGLHEWAMVHRAEEHGTRHDRPLRLGADGTDRVVESHRIGCSHFDAFRFFTPSARPLNTLDPGREDRPAFEQPGCLHAGMDLYKHAFRLSPLVPSELVADAFELAWDIRILDMRAAPYDLTGLTLDPTGEPWTPVAIETAEGKAAYVAAQREFSERGAPIRQRLVDWCDRLLTGT